LASDRGARTTSAEAVSKKLAPVNPICDLQPASALLNRTLSREGPAHSSNDLITALQHLNI
jgi:hypothetical protein